MADPFHVPDDWFGKLAAAAVAAVVTAFATWLTNRRVQKANIETMIVNAAGGLVDRLEKECSRVTAECAAVRQENAAIREQHTKETAEIREQHANCERRLDDLEREKRELRAEIEKLMRAQPAAIYGADHATQAQRIGRAAQERNKGETE